MMSEKGRDQAVNLAHNEPSLMVAERSSGMRSKLTRCGVALVLLMVAGILIGGSIGVSGKKPEERPSWEEQLTRVQKVMREVDPDATLQILTAWVVFDGKNVLGRNEQNKPFPLTTIVYRFDGSTPGRGYWLYDYDTEVGAYRPLTATTQFAETEITLDHPIRITELQTALPIGPFDICQSTLAAAQKLMHADLGHMKCSTSLDLITSEQKFGIPAVWFVTWTNFEGKKRLQEIDLWINPATGEQLKMKTDVRQEGMLSPSWSAGG